MMMMSMMMMIVIHDDMMSMMMVMLVIGTEWNTNTLLLSSLQYCWRWTGFLYGLDIIVMYNNRTRQLSFRRNTYIHPTHGVICVQRQHSFMVKVDIASFHSNGSEKYHKTSGLRHLSLGLDEEVRILQVDRHVTYPIYVSAHIALVSVPTDKPQAME